jgi:ribonuclease R
LAETETLRRFSTSGRLDWRATPFVTIDPHDARDHDDAVFAKSDDQPDNRDGVIVTVAIADVAAYVTSGSATDREASLRGNSTYFPDRVVPMLPERISNDLCSLREAEDRPAIAVTMTFNKNGQKLRHKFDRVVIRSAAKLSYEEAQAAIDGRPSKKASSVFSQVLQPLWAAYRILEAARDARSPLELDLPERKIRVDEQGNIIGISIPPRLDAHKLIEEFMIQANVAAAEQLENAKASFLYRIHEEPAREKLVALAEFAKSVGQKFSLGNRLHPSLFNRLLKQAATSEHKHAIHEVVLRTQSQACYSPKSLGHFGLALSKYAHFTSPIRRYADLIVHRALITALQLGNDGLSKEDIESIEDIAERISNAERRSMIAERETIDRLVAAHLKDKIGATFEGRISGVVGPGLFVKLEETGADGFVPASTLGGDFYVFDKKRHALVGRRTGESFQLGDRLSVRLLETAPLKGGMRFEIANASEKRLSLSLRKRKR